jgi:hypothetical protein
MTTGAALLIGSGAAQAICRIVGEPESPPPAVEPDQPVLIIKRSQVIGEQCDPPVATDGGPTADAGWQPDAGPDGDAGGWADAGIGDGGMPADGAWPCEPIEGEAITMVVQPRFRIGADGAAFALLMVTPTPPAVSLAAPELFRDLALATAPEAVVVPDYVEDRSLGYQCSDPKWNSEPVDCGGSGGYWSYDDDYDLPEPEPVDLPEPDDAALVDTIGAYQVARLQLAEVGELATWLTDNGYQHTAADLEALRPYVEDGWTTVAVRVTADGALDGGLEPLSMTWEGSEIRLPLGVSRQPAPAEAWLTVYIAAEGRYELPTANISYAQPTAMGGARFLTRNDLWADLSLGAVADPVAFAIDGNPTYRDTVEVRQEIRIPSSDCPPPPPRDRDDDPSLCGCRAAGDLGLSGLLMIALIAGSGWSASRRRR